jgi:hypothetical protein
MHFSTQTFAKLFAETVDVQNFTYVYCTIEPKIANCCLFSFAKVIGWWLQL